VSACTVAQFTLPLLTSPMIISLPAFAIGSLLTCLDAPELRELTIHQVGRFDPLGPPLSWTPALLAGRSFAKLKKLTLAHPLLGVDLIDVLHTMHELESLHLLNACHNVGVLISALVPQDDVPGASIICAKLRLLEILGCCVGQDLAVCVTKRAAQLWQGVFLLFVNDACPDLSHADLEAMKMMASYGAQLRYKWCRASSHLLALLVRRFASKPAEILADRERLNHSAADESDSIVH
jgi:hypothetical protein